MALLAAVNRFKFLKPVTPGPGTAHRNEKTDRGWANGVHRRNGMGGRGEMVASGELSVVSG